MVDGKSGFGRGSTHVCMMQQSIISNAQSQRVYTVLPRAHILTRCTLQLHAHSHTTPPFGTHNIHGTDLGMDEEDDEPVPLPNVNGAIMRKVTTHM